MLLKNLLNLIYLIVLVLFSAGDARSMKQLIKKKGPKFLTYHSVQNYSFPRFCSSQGRTSVNNAACNDLENDDVIKKFEGMTLKINKNNGNDYDSYDDHDDHDPHEPHEPDDDPENGIHPYKEEYEPELRKIALADAPRLATTNVFTQEEYERLYQENIAPAFRDEAVSSMVYLVDGKPVGFINYSFYMPFYQKLTQSDLGPDAILEHIAVDKEFRKHGYGAQLMRYVLDDCKKRNVNKVSFWTTSYAQDHFFSSFGFSVFRYTKLGETGYMLRLKEHPIKLLYCELKKKLN